MSEGEVAEPMRGGLDTVVSFPAPNHPGPNHPAPSQVSFDRHELERSSISMAERSPQGEWRDYAIDFTSEKAVFSIFRRSSEVPLYRVEKDPRLARRQGAYAVVAGTGLTLKRGHDLRHVLRAIDRPMRVVS